MKKIDKYEIIGELGRGAFGRVYKVLHPLIDEVFALKVYDPSPKVGVDAEHFRERFIAEAKVLHRISHPHIVTIRDVGIDAGTPYYVMEYIPYNLAVQCEETRVGLPPESEVVRLGAQILSALECLHASRIVHRDLKPANILLDDARNVKLADFGIAKIGNLRGYTKTGMFMGSPEFMAPEQRDASQADHRSDLFSTGMLLYLLLIGLLPGQTRYELPSKMRPGISAGWDQLIWKATEQEPDDRYQSAGEMRKALDQILYIDEESSRPQVSAASGITVSDPPARITNSIGMEFVYIVPGTFMMGSPDNEPERSNKEILHRVTLTKGYYLQTTPVTQAQWQAVMGDSPSEFKGDDLPVECVAWDKAQEFIKKLNRRENITTYRLPTEAEWEYACRAGTSTPFFFGRCLGTDQANYNGNYNLERCPQGECRRKTTPVKMFAPNAWGLHDMHGNVWEWCADWFGDYPSSAVTDPTGPSIGSDRVPRGGSWDGSERFCRSAYRGNFSPGSKRYNLGFRLARTP